MNIKSRVESDELKAFRILKSRKTLSTEEADQLARLEKGYEGELLFDERVNRLSKEWLVLDDLQLESNNTNFQIDSIIIAQKLILLFEIKNHEGDYYIEDGKWYYINGTPIQNPVNQLERSESLFRRLLQELGNNIPIESYIIYVNPDFHIYNTIRNLPIIFPNQLNRFFTKLDQLSSKVNGYHMRLAKKIASLHKIKSSYSNLPKYSYDKLRKGVICANCSSFNLESKRRVLTCKNCGTIEIFPNQKITTSIIFDWCNGIRSEDTIRRVLLKHYAIKGNGKASYYERTT
ncbi:nuclease-related domain-containing protein [Lederbergia wuyishanensis]|uniref:NERD domain-containing protein n=1 Tax=Lederbergia wuyishanensis TaxID=1347903 RepID=A0ABU0D8P5_9BACI|nr:nuclease-related domain-containing protein [Lederbergia wuyishanensis]MCJ8007636.1 NERD domain-containing protein [Lederbergia wuyishanensis]MDQ0344779.1 hypothetical protein [Lederbergia wuyishanensis]